MFQIGEVVSYGTVGICTIVDIRMEALSRAGVKRQEYYALQIPEKEVSAYIAARMEKG